MTIRKHKDTMTVFQAELYDKVHKKVVSKGSVRNMLDAYNMAMLTQNGDFEIRPQKKQQDGRDFTFDVVFVNKTDEDHMNLNTTLMECLRYIAHNQGTKNGFFGKYSGHNALVGVYCLEREVLVCYYAVR